MTLKEDRARAVEAGAAASTVASPGGPPETEHPVPAALPVEPPAKDDQAAIRADILATRQALGRTVELLADRVNPATRTREAADRARQRMSELSRVALRRRGPLIAVLASVSITLTGLLLWHARREHHSAGCRH
ncbi:uncharacterized protein DUF3618 [Stackebrandtia albiflava]|uniref:Uncharacterized protein DUF3618 n=1 Tax=Stackebrandtia albiflava TaxID=406432 RepID=A0A562VE03_9ACTN|nr:DUF3618 domain-containing protein [Stackebrandtia albiflava]TWJ16116.1 uncharacterized protein DUF3618 [Stackebrandtia albiflava]